MENKIINLRNFLIKRKIWLLRSTGYIGITNSIFIIMIYLNVSNNTFLDSWISKIVLIGSWILFLIFMGWIEAEKIKAPHTEARTLLKYNPPLKFIYDKVKSIDEGMEDLKKELNKLQKIKEKKHD